MRPRLPNNLHNVKHPHTVGCEALVPNQDRGFDEIVRIYLVGDGWRNDELQEVKVQLAAAA